MTNGSVLATASPTRQSAISIALAGGIVGGWVVIHIFGIFLVTWTPRQTALAPLLIAAQAWLSTGLFIVAHDCMHGSFAPGRPRVNRAVGSVALMIYAGLSYARLLPKHYEHHRHVGTARDPDFNADDPYRLLPWLLRFFFTYYTHAQLARITMVALAYILVFGASLINIALFWALPALLALVQLFVFGTYLPHRHTAEPFVDNHCARSSAFGPFASLVSCFHFGGYHHEHHLRPDVPWWALPGRQVRAR